MPANDYVRRLAQLVNDMKGINAKLSDLNRGWLEPPDPDKPAIRASLESVKTEAAISTQQADAMLAKLAGV
jgi:hypothetical protein